MGYTISRNHLPERERSMENNKSKCGNGNDKNKKPQSEVYDSTECHLEDSNVAIPTDEAVENAKEWVDDENRK